MKPHTSDGDAKSNTRSAPSLHAAASLDPSGENDMAVIEEDDTCQRVMGLARPLRACATVKTDASFTAGNAGSALPLMGPEHSIPSRAVWPYM